LLTLLNWIELGEKVIFGPDILDDVEATVRCMQDNLRTTIMEHFDLEFARDPRSVHFGISTDGFHPYSTDSSPSSG
jgi:hypothetical protein